MRASRRVFKANIQKVRAVVNGRVVKRPELLVGPDWTVTSGTVVDFSCQLSGIFAEEVAAIAGLRGMFRQAGAIMAVSVTTAILARSSDPGRARRSRS